MKTGSRVAYVTLILIAVNIIAAFGVLLHPELVENLGFQSGAPTLTNALVSLFLHANVMHLMGNMVFLAAVGVAVEIATGSGRFTLVYFVSGLLGVFVFWLATRRMEDAPALVGASGCIAGCATYYSVRYTKLRVPLAPKKSATVAGVTLVWLALQVAGAFINFGQPVNQSGFFAHLGGAMGGLLLGVFFRAPDLGDRRLGHQVLEALNDLGPARQIEHARQHLLEHPEDVEMQMKLAASYREAGDKKDEAALLLKLVEFVPSDDTATVLNRLIDLNVIDQIPPFKRRQLADKVGGDVAHELLASVVAMNKTETQRPEALLELATRLKEEGRTDFDKLMTLLQTDYPLHPTLDIARQRGLL